jgi:ADP-heptose:LPS heptosyltransferase
MTGSAKRFLVVRLADIGDAILALPALQALRTANPDARIDVLTTGAGANVFQLSPAVDDVVTMAKQRFDRVLGLVSPRGILELAGITLRLRKPRYDAVMLLHHLTTEFGARKFRALARATGAPIVAGLDNGRGRFLTHRAIDFGFGAKSESEYALDVMRAIGAHAANVQPQLELPQTALQAADSLLRNSGIKDGYVVMHAEVGDFSPARAWSDLKFAKLARSIVSETGRSVVLVGLHPNRPGMTAYAEVTGVHNLCGRTTFNELCAVVASASLVIGADSAVSHLAGAFNRPVVSVFGPSNVAAWKPWNSSVVQVDERPRQGSNGVALHLDLPCSPCIYTGFRLGRPEGCRSRACLSGIQPEHVLPHALRMLSGQ